MSKPNTKPKLDTPPPSVPIGVVERETGLSRDALRKWEIRYGFPTPSRDPRGERIYPLEQLDQLRLIKRLIDCGMRPAKLAKLDAGALRQLADSNQATTAPPPPNTGFVSEVFAALKQHQPEGLQRRLTQELMRVGLKEFVQAKLADLHELIGDAWAEGRLAIHQEHLYSEIVQNVLREAIGRLPVANEGPRVLLATLPGELHTLGLLMVQAHLSLSGVRCISLGSQAPISELVAAAQAHQVDAIGLSFSITFPVRRIAPQLSELRRQLPPAVQLWAGGRGVGRVRSIPPGVSTFLTMNAASEALAAGPARG